MSAIRIAKGGKGVLDKFITDYTTEAVRNKKITANN